MLQFPRSHVFLFLFAFFLWSSTGFGQNVLLSENFEGNSFPSGWTQQTLATDGGWLMGMNSELQSDWWSISPNGQFIATNDDGCDCDKSEDYLIMPPFDFSTIAGAMLQFESFYDGGTFEGTTEVVTIEFSLDDGISWDILEEIQGSDDGEWNAYTVSLNALLGE